MIIARRCVEILIWLSLMFLFLNSVALAAEREDYRHKLCAEGKLSWLDIGGSGASVSPSDEVYRTDRPFYAEVKRGGKIIGGCIPAGTPISAKKGNRFAEHFALKGWRDILNFIPLPVSTSSKEENKKIIFLTNNQVEKMIKKEKEQNIQANDDEILGLKKDTWRKVFYCAGGAATGYGVRSNNAGLIGGGVAVVGVTLYFDSEKSFADQLTSADVGVTVLCGVAGYFAAPAEKSNAAPSNPASGTPAPGPNPPLGPSTPGTGGPSSPPL